jgi:hypothetical protein
MTLKISHLTVRPSNLTDADLKAFLDGMKQRKLSEYEQR